MTPDTFRMRLISSSGSPLMATRSRELAGRDGTKLLRAAQGGSRAQGRRADRIERRHAVFDHVCELACVVPVRVDPGIRAKADADARP